MMNPIILKPYIGLDAKHQPIAGIIRHVAQYAKGGLPISYLVQLYPNEDGHRAGCAIVPADLIRDHLAGLALVASMEKDSE